jgi:diketogulonate reductase-like aldo/keto reductase
MDTFVLPSGEPVSPLGQGTWKMGESRRRHDEELAALIAGIELGMTLIDTAEMYGSGAAEALVGEAIAGRRERVYVVSKVLPQNAARAATIKACERSLRQLGTDYLDLYLLHWRGARPLAETLEAFVALEQAGKIRRYGVGNFDVEDLEEAATLPGGAAIATNQVLYNPLYRAAEWGLLPWCRERGVPVMAYSPLGSSGSELKKLLGAAAVRAVAARHAATSAQVLLAWALRQPGVVTIPKAATLEHVRENHGALKLALTAEDWRDIDAAFPPPRRAVPLETI